METKVQNNEKNLNSVTDFSIKHTGAVCCLFLHHRHFKKVAPAGVFQDSSGTITDSPDVTVTPISM